MHRKFAAAAVILAALALPFAVLFAAPSQGAEVGPSVEAPPAEAKPVATAGAMVKAVAFGFVQFALGCATFYVAHRSQVRDLAATVAKLRSEVKAIRETGSLDRLTAMAKDLNAARTLIEDLAGALRAKKAARLAFQDAWSGTRADRTTDVPDSMAVKPCKLGDPVTCCAISGRCPPVCPQHETGPVS